MIGDENVFRGVVCVAREHWKKVTCGRVVICTDSSETVTCRGCQGLGINCFLKTKNSWAHGISENRP